MSNDCALGQEVLSGGEKKKKTVGGSCNAGDETMDKVWSSEISVRESDTAVILGMSFICDKTNVVKKLV